jgi:hypothetical protein
VVTWRGYHDDDPNPGVFARRLGIPQASGISAVKLIVVDKVVASGKAKVVYVAKNDAGIQKGAGGDPALLSGSFDVFYTDRPSSVAGSFVLPSPWRTAKDVVAKYVNSQAPGGPGQAKVAVVKDGVTAKVVAKGLGDGPALDVVAAGPPTERGRRHDGPRGRERQRRDGGPHVHALLRRRRQHDALQGDRGRHGPEARREERRPGAVSVRPPARRMKG